VTATSVFSVSSPSVGCFFLGIKIHYSIKCGFRDLCLAFLISREVLEQYLG
jgi:hypothetical protein